MKDIDKIKLLKPTAKSIFEIAKQLNMVDKIYNELSKCSELFKDEDIKKYFIDKSIPKKCKIEIIENKLKPIFSREAYVFISILMEHEVIDILPDILVFYKEIRDNEYNNIIRVRIIAADNIDNETIEDIIKTVKCFSNKEIVYSAEVDKDILGGIIIYIDSKVYDYSVKNQVYMMQDKIINFGGNKIFKIF
ncbi:ATP synthase F1 subunit delta [Brachyspira aalborgi]|jgi:F-type H+-transporting ATPase subunit delta|uniref:ATP synthase subunit delta n=1 Tax=Brachyspira aalborgi TaxID=29522 RepID=A0A5C8CIA0_9SPIR|nr:ATP synthase F1 subunit delta [Brachyspira aalborgi]MBS4763270.1 ATP synthase F1 subunit delta [Brachyspira sp.]CCY74758.1 aTP synthase subunit delta 1 [Brachyspira sp. CAG:700]TXJ12353.1 ATP synthase F1 subunit delta [Brachyspira aalborgi]TXJ33747.1 ATP synthase F1 subunit delta [Brachyspira aalborgi]TXJ38126.1 ATP synthase F1 subunit delta [Brachyspira aalborgi]